MIWVGGLWVLVEEERRKGKRKGEERRKGKKKTGLGGGLREDGVRLASRRSCRAQRKLRYVLQTAWRPCIIFPEGNWTSSGQKEPASFLPTSNDSPLSLPASSWRNNSHPPAYILSDIPCVLSVLVNLHSLLRFAFVAPVVHNSFVPARPSPDDRSLLSLPTW